MSLTGNLDDLPLLDILQIVSFSKKSGYLLIRTGDGESGIVFLAGLVVSASELGKQTASWARLIAKVPR